MVSNLKLSVFMAGLIITFSMAIYAVVKVRRLPKVMKFIITGVLTSLAVTVLSSVFVVLVAGVFPGLFKTDLVWVSIGLLFFFEVAPLILGYSFLMTKVIKEQLGKVAAFALTLGYMLNVTVGNFRLYINNFTGGFAYNMGQLQDVLDQEQYDSFVRLVVEPDVFQHLSAVLFIIVTWLVFAKVFRMNIQDPRQKRGAFIILGIYTFMTVILSVHLLPSVLALIIVLVGLIVLVRDFKRVPWN